MAQGGSRLSKTSPRAVLQSPAGFVALGFGAGLTPVAPGTAGTVVAIPLALVLQQISLWWALAATALMFVAGVWVCQRAAQALGGEDPGSIVWDEIVGYCLVLILIPSGWIWLIAAFVAFRVFDIVKPWPVRWLENNSRGGLGIMIDDIAAALYSVAVLRLVELLVAS